MCVGGGTRQRLTTLFAELGAIVRQIAIVSWVDFYLVLFWFIITFTVQLNSLCSRRFYPQRSCEQAVVTGEVPSSPRYVPSFVSLVLGFSIPTARQFHRM